jgi:membrane protein DedA with SNARE-associated domain
MAGMPWRRFLVFNALGAALWVGAWVTFGGLAGAHLDTLYPAIQRYELYVLIAAAVLIVILIARHLYHRRRGDAARQPDA